MKFIDKKISDTYFQLYIILNVKEKKSLITNIKNEILINQKEDLKEQINIYKTINKTTNTDVSKDKLNELTEKYNSLNINNLEYNQKEIEEKLTDEILKDIIDHISSINLIQVFQGDIQTIGSIDDNNPLTLIYSFCYISYDYNLILPKQKGNTYLFTSKDTDMIQTEMMIAQKLYTKEKVEKVSEFSDLLFSYMCRDDMKFNLYMDISEIEHNFNIDRSELIDLDRNKYLVYNRDKEKCILNIKEIYDKQVFDITDEYVKKINFLNSRTIEELRKNIEDVYSYIYNINSNVTSILQGIIEVNDFKIDEYVKKHYFKQIDEEETENISNEIMDEIKLSFITSYIFSKYDINIDNYIFYLENEYKLIYRIKKNDDGKSLEEYFNMKAPYYALYEFFKQKNLVTERSNNE